MPVNRGDPWRSLRWWLQNCARDGYSICRTLGEVVGSRDQVGFDSRTCPYLRTLRQTVRMDVAKELTFTGRILNAEEANELGLVTHVTENPRDAAIESRPRNRWSFTYSRACW